MLYIVHDKDKNYNVVVEAIHSLEAVNLAQNWLLHYYADYFPVELFADLCDNLTPVQRVKNNHKDKE